jgi:hypothetical protein
MIDKDFLDFERPPGNIQFNNCIAEMSRIQRDAVFLFNHRDDYTKNNVYELFFISLSASLALQRVNAGQLSVRYS